MSQSVPLTRQHCRICLSFCLFVCLPLCSALLSFRPICPFSLMSLIFSLPYILTSRFCSRLPVGPSQSRHHSASPVTQVRRCECESVCTTSSLVSEGKCVHHSKCLLQQQSHRCHWSTATICPICCCWAKKLVLEHVSERAKKRPICR